MPLSRTHADVSIGAGGLNFGLESSYTSILCVYEPLRLCQICEKNEGLPESLLVNAISTKISCWLIYMCHSKIKLIVYIYAAILKLPEGYLFYCRSSIVELFSTENPTFRHNLVAS